MGAGEADDSSPLGAVVLAVEPDAGAVTQFDVGFFLRRGLGAVVEVDLEAGPGFAAVGFVGADESCAGAEGLAGLVVGAV